MTVSLIIIAALVVVGLPLYLLHRRDTACDGSVADTPGSDTSLDPGINRRPASYVDRGDGCCGQHEVCERDSLLADASETVEYFDDEELDRFRGREADGYSPEEIDEFTEVLLTTRPDEVAAWSRSLQLRGITLPTLVREQLLLIVAERRGSPPN